MPTLPRCILPLHSNCWAEISTLAASEFAQKKQFPDSGTTSQQHAALSWFAPTQQAETEATGRAQREGNWTVIVGSPLSPGLHTAFRLLTELILEEIR